MNKNMERRCIKTTSVVQANVMLWFKQIYHKQLNSIIPNVFIWYYIIEIKWKKYSYIHLIWINICKYTLASYFYIPSTGVKRVVIFLNSLFNTAYSSYLRTNKHQDSSFHSQQFTINTKHSEFHIQISVMKTEEKWLM